jgi:hypothetical protein
MINLSFNISNPWHEEKAGHDYFYRAWQISKNKTLDMQLSHSGSNLAECRFMWRMRTDHAGVSLGFGLFYRWLHIEVCDNRHWNDEEGRYVDYDNPEEVKKYW